MRAIVLTNHSALINDTVYQHALSIGLQQESSNWLRQSNIYILCYRMDLLALQTPLFENGNGDGWSLRACVVMNRCSPLRYQSGRWPKEMISNSVMEQAQERTAAAGRKEWLCVRDKVIILGDTRERESRCWKACRSRCVKCISGCVCLGRKQNVNVCMSLSVHVIQKKKVWTLRSSAQ